ncbi:MAG: GAF domain-containing protein [bacterium]
MKRAGLVSLVVVIFLVVSFLLYLAKTTGKTSFIYGYAYFFTLPIVLASLLGLFYSLSVAVASWLILIWATFQMGEFWVSVIALVSWLLAAYLTASLLSSFERRLRYFSTLSDIEKKMCGMLNMSQLLSTMVEETAKALGVKGCSIRLLDQSGQKLEIKAVYGLSKEYLDKGPVDVEHSKVDKEVLEGKIVYIEDATKDPRFQYPEEAKREGIVSVLSVPLRVADRKIGVVRIYTSEPRKFTKDEIDFVNSIATQAAIAIQNAALYESLRQQYKDVEDILWKSIW